MEQLNCKKEILIRLDEKIAQLVDEKDLEAEIVESADIQSSVSRHITQVKCLLNTTSPRSWKAPVAPIQDTDDEPPPEDGNEEEG